MSQLKTASSKNLLILGGTAEAIELAARAAKIPNVNVITALAGRTQHPVLPSTTTQIGGFGGVAGLANYLQSKHIHLLIDATHPFAAKISWNAAAAAAQTGVPHLMFVRSAWDKAEDDHWIEVENNQAAARILPSLAQRIFLTIGRQELATFASLKTLWFLMRMIEPPLPNAPVPPGKLLLERGPFSLEQERSLLQQYEIAAIVSKNSGGGATYAKIIAARELRIPVVMVQRPSLPVAEQASDLNSALSWLSNRLSLLN